MDIKSAKKDLPKLKLSLKKETLRPISDRELYMLDSVVGGTGCDTSGCPNTAFQVQ